MSESQSSQEKTEEATPQKLKKSKQDGQVARSKDLTTAISLVATLLALKFSTLFYLDILQAAFRKSYVDFNSTPLSATDLPMIMGQNLGLLLLIALPLLVTPILICTLSNLGGGWVFASKNFMPKFDKLNPIKGLGRMFSMQNLSEVFKSILKIVVMLLLAWWLMRGALSELFALQRQDLFSALGQAFNLLFNIVFMLLMIFVVFAFIDIPLQKFFFLKKMRMTKQERKEEHKNQEGRPEVKARIKQVQRQMLERQINKVIDKADVVITNPTHFAVALKYDPNRAKAPYVIAKGVDETALYIRKLATSHNLEILDIPPLARAIYFTTQVNQQIPAPLYTAVAHVLNYILQLRAYRQGRRTKPKLTRNLNIPNQLANRVNT